MKAIGRPAFILMDKDVDSKTKGYSAMKEFLYQAICLGVYLAVIPLVFKRGMFALAKHGIFKNTKGFEHFKNCNEYLDYRKLASLDLQERANVLAGKIDENITDPKKIESAKKTLNNLKESLKKFENKPDLYNALQNEKNPEKYDMLYGTIEAGSYVGSLLGLAILAPEVGHVTIHPIMRALGLEKKPEKAEQNEKLDVKA